MKEKKIYRAGIYLRLSREDGGIGESNSIQSQRELALSFVDGHSDIQVYGFYVDDGYSGVSFERPGFGQMMRDVETGLVDCVIVKDLSRLGRDYIEAGRLIQKTFPALCVRFIAITDHYDSLTAGYNEFSLVLPVKNFVNDSYCRDISCKVRSHQTAKRERGEFTGAFPVYGYRKDPGRKGRLVPDAYAAQVVRDIFAWRLEGISAAAIARRLNEFGILSPMEYKRIQGESYCTCFGGNGMARWSASAVMRILTNEIYTGTMVQGKGEKINYKLSVRRKKSREEWIRVEHTHEPLVSEEDFGKAHRLLETKSRACRGKEAAHLFSGLLFCGDCQSPMIRKRNMNKKGEKIFFICAAKNEGRGCSRHSISEEELKEKVRSVLRERENCPSERKEKIRKGSGEEEALKFRNLQNEIQRLHREAQRYLNLKKRLGEDRKRGILSEEDFKAFGEIYERKYRGINEAARRQEEYQRRRAAEEQKDLEGEADRNPDHEFLSRDQLLSHVNRVYVYENKCVRIWFREEGV